MSLFTTIYPWKLFRFYEYDLTLIIDGFAFFYFRNFTWLSHHGDRLKFDLSWAGTESR